MKKTSSLIFVTIVTCAALYVGWAMHHSNGVPKPVAVSTVDFVSTSVSDPAADIRLSPETTLSPEEWAGHASRLKSIHRTSLEVGTSPLLSRLEELKRRANSGDAAAALQLSFELSYCEEASAVFGVASDAAQEATATSPPSADRLRDAEVAMAQADGINTLCRGISQEDIESQYEWLELAARLGDAKAQLMYLTKGSAIPVKPELMFSHPEEVIAFKAKGRQFVEAAAAECNVEALYEMSDKYAQGAWYPQDTVVSYAYGVLADRVAGGLPGSHPPPLWDLTSLGESERARIESLAARLYSRNCL